MSKKPSIKLEFSNDNNFHFQANTGKDIKKKISNELQGVFQKKLEKYKEKVNMMVGDYKKIQDELDTLRHPKKKIKEKDLLKNEIRINELKKKSHDLEEEFKMYMKDNNLVDRSITTFYTLLPGPLLGKNRLEFIK
jgi:hypothetical protein